jgi:asparagine synthase (glutamine-hydrolysing)
VCGIAGSVALGSTTPPPDRSDLEAMVAALRHRGPDESGLYRDHRVALGHARLSIIDLATGQQPLAGEDDRVWVVFNGEIYNYLELREELIALGHVFRTRSDTEVIVHAWEQWSDGAFARFNGQFAIALWDSVDETLVLARDPMGVRPLYLCQHGGRLWFASEVKAIFAGAPSLPRRLDPAGLAEVFTFWTSVAPQGVFDGITELEPGHVRTVRAGQVTDRAFWEPRYPGGGAAAFDGSVEDASRAVLEALEASVHLRMLRADVPVGSYLSGGLDSSLVAALGLLAKGARFSTFSIRFEDAEYDETPFQRLMAAHLGSDHHEVLVTRRAIADAFPAVVAHAERPLLRTAPAPLFLLSELVRQSGIKVVLTGEGADELFAGYDLFREGKVRRFWGRQPDSTLRPQLMRRLYPYLSRSPVAQQAMAEQYFGRDREAWADAGFAHQPRWRGTAALQRLFTPDLRRQLAGADVTRRLLSGLPPEFARWHPLAQDQYLEIRTLLSGYLLSSQGDRMLMAHSVEGRFPFLDPHLVELANTLPAAYKLRSLDEKHVLKRAAAGLVPEAILRRPKQPYRAPDALAFIGDDRPGWVDEVVSPGNISLAGVFDPVAVESLWQKCRTNAGRAQLSNADNMALVGVLSTGLLVEQLVRRGPGRQLGVEFQTAVDRLATAPSAGGMPLGGTVGQPR